MWIEATLILTLVIFVALLSLIDFFPDEKKSPVDISKLRNEELQALADDITKKAHLCYAEEKSGRIKSSYDTSFFCFDKDGNKLVYVDGIELNTTSLTIQDWVTDKKVAQISKLLKAAQNV